MPVANDSARSCALLVDGTALFLASRILKGDRNLDYLRLADCLKRATQVQAFDLAIFFTSFDRNNEGQAKFLDFVDSRLGWSVDAVPMSEAVLRPTTDPNEKPYVRFDARIAFCLGRIAEQFKQAIVVSDSYPLADPMLETAKRGTKVQLGFFGQMLDARWSSMLNTATSPISWIDFDKETPDLFGGDISSDQKAFAGKRHLP